MDRLFALVIFLFSVQVYAATSAVIYPFSRVDQLLRNSTLTLESQSSVRAVSTRTFYSGGFMTTTAESTAFSSFGTSASEAIANAVTMRAQVVPSLARQLGSVAIKGGAIFLASWALEKGLSYYSGQWMQSATPAGGPYTTYWSFGQSCQSNTLQGACACYLQDLGPDYSWAVTGDHCTSYREPQHETWGTFYPGQQQVNSANNCYGGTTYNSSTGSCIWPSTQRPATDADFSNLAINGRDLSDAELKALIDAGWFPPVSEPTTVIGDFAHLNSDQLSDLQAMGFFQPSPGVGAFPVGDPVTNPVTGQKTQPYVQLEAAPNAGIRITPYEQPLNPDGTPATDGQGNPLPNQERNPDPCELDPSRAGCATLGELDADTPAASITQVSITPQTDWGNAGQCPSPASLNFLGQPIAFEFTPACDFFSAMRPIVIAAAWVMATLVFIGGAKGNEA